MLNFVKLVLVVLVFISYEGHAQETINLNVDAARQGMSSSEASKLVRSLLLSEGKLFSVKSKAIVKADFNDGYSQNFMNVNPLYSYGFEPTGPATSNDNGGRVAIGDVVCYRELPDGNGGTYTVEVPCS